MLVEIVVPDPALVPTLAIVVGITIEPDTTPVALAVITAVLPFTLSTVVPAGILACVSGWPGTSDPTTEVRLGEPLVPIAVTLTVKSPNKGVSGV